MLNLNGHISTNQSTFELSQLHAINAQLRQENSLIRRENADLVAKNLNYEIENKNLKNELQGKDSEILRLKEHLTMLINQPYSSSSQNYRPEDYQPNIATIGGSIWGPSSTQEAIFTQPNPNDMLVLFVDAHAQPHHQPQPIPTTSACRNTIINPETSFDQQPRGYINNSAITSTSQNTDSHEKNVKIPRKKDRSVKKDQLENENRPMVLKEILAKKEESIKMLERRLGNLSVKSNLKDSKIRQLEKQLSKFANPDGSFPVIKKKPRKRTPIKMIMPIENEIETTPSISITITNTKRFPQPNYEETSDAEHEFPPTIPQIPTVSTIEPLITDPIIEVADENLRKTAEKAGKNAKTLSSILRSSKSPIKQKYNREKKKDVDKTYDIRKDEEKVATKKRVRKRPLGVKPRKLGPFKCSHCEKLFKRSQGLRNHMRIHTGERPYVCVVCDKRFNQPINLKKHLRIHTDERPYKCQHCDATFKTNDHRMQHERIHTDERPYECTACGSRFHQMATLYNHRKNRHGCNGSNQEQLNFE